MLSEDEFLVRVSWTRFDLRFHLRLVVLKRSSQAEGRVKVDVPSRVVQRP